MSRSPGIAASKLLPALVAGAALLLASAATALPVTPTFNWRGSAPGSDPNEWNATIGSHQWNLSGVTSTNPTTSYAPLATGAFAFGAGSSATGTTFQNIASGNPSNEDVSFEIWFRPDSMSGGEQVLFETGGGGDGLSLLLDDNLLSFRVKDSGTTVTTAAFDLGSDTSEFFQAAITLSRGGTASLYVDGALATSTSAAGINDWTGSNGAALGGRNGNVGGNDGGDLNGYGAFQGEIALFRFYRNQVLTVGEVQQNFDAVATPEPGTAVLGALGLIGLAGYARRNRKRTRR